MQESTNIEWEDKGSKRRGKRVDVSPPLLCEDCGKSWTLLRQNVYVSGKTKNYLVWEYLYDFPKIGCDLKVCPKCGNIKNAIYREIK